MTWLWTWGGTSFGYRDGDDLLTHAGDHVGRFWGDEVFGTGGQYLGEILNGRLITDQRKGGRTGSPFLARDRAAQLNRMAQMASMMPMGYDDFPDPDEM